MCDWRDYETATPAVDRQLGHSFKTPKVQCDCLKVGRDGVETYFQAVARHFGRRGLVAAPIAHKKSVTPYNAFAAVS